MTIAQGGGGSLVVVTHGWQSELMDRKVVEALISRKVAPVGLP